MPPRGQWANVRVLSRKLLGMKLTRYMLNISHGMKKFIFTFHAIPLLWLGTGIWNPSSSKTKTYLYSTESISWLLMSWLLASPGHQQPWYWFLPRTLRVNFTWGHSPYYWLSKWRCHIHYPVLSDHHMITKPTLGWRKCDILAVCMWYIIVGPDHLFPSQSIL